MLSSGRIRPVPPEPLSAKAQQPGITEGLRRQGRNSRNDIVRRRVARAKRPSLLTDLLVDATDCLAGAAGSPAILRCRREVGWNWYGVVSGCFNPNESSVDTPDRRPRHDEHYHEAGCRSA